MGEERNRPDPAALLARAGVVRDEAVARAALDAAAKAVEPFAEEGARAAIAWAAERWPDFTRRTVLPTLQEALGAEDGAVAPAHPSGRRPAAYVAAALAAVAAARLLRR